MDRYITLLGGYVESIHSSNLMMHVVGLRSLPSMYPVPNGTERGHYYGKQLFQANRKKDLLREAEKLLKSFSRRLYVFDYTNDTLRLGMRYREDWMQDIKDELASKIPDLSRSEIDSLFNEWFESEQDLFLKHEKQKKIDRATNRNPYSHWREAYNENTELMEYLVKKYEGIVRCAFKQGFIGSHMMTTKVIDDIELTILSKSDDIRLTRSHAIDLANHIIDEILTK